MPNAADYVVSVLCTLLGFGCSYLSMSALYGFLRTQSKVSLVVSVIFLLLAIAVSYAALSVLGFM